MNVVAPHAQGTALQLFLIAFWSPYNVALANYFRAGTFASLLIAVLAAFAAELNFFDTTTAGALVWAVIALGYTGSILTPFLAKVCAGGGAGRHGE